MSGCACVLLYTVDHRKCGAPVVATLTMGCVHEHLQDDEFCKRHAELARNASNTMACTDCWNMDDGGHRCVVRVVAEVTPSGERRPFQPGRVSDGAYPDGVVTP